MSLFCSKCEEPVYARDFCKKCYRKAMYSGEIKKKFTTRPSRNYEDNVCSSCEIKGTMLVKSQCRVCYQKRKDKEKYDANPEAMRLKYKTWAADNPEARKATKLASYHKHKEARQAKVAEYRIINREKLREKAKLRYTENKLFYKYKRLEWNYGLMPEQYNAMVDAQQGCCYLCKIKENLVVDHDHATGKLRKLLCNHCNSILGFLESRGHDVFDNAKKYLEDHKENVQPNGSM